MKANPRPALETRKGLIQLLILFCLLALFMAAPATAPATEGGGSHYPNGAEDFMSGAAPPPGTYLINYMNFYTSNKFRLRHGNEIPDFKLNAFAEVVRVVHITKYQILGANWGVHAFVPVANVDVRLPYGSQSRFGLGDIIVDPFILSWHSKNLHVTTGVDVYIPTGAYNKDRLANIGRRYWTFEPVIAATIVTNEGLEFSAKLMYDFNTKNTATEYTSGNEFHADYTIGYKIGAFNLGVGGYFYKQVTDDKVNGMKVGEDGFRGQVFAVGPQVKYDYKNMSFIAKYQRELAVENRPEGNNFWFKFVYAF
jgi:hypothetical protein